jgi:hypothetical protein
MLQPGAVRYLLGLGMLSTITAIELLNARITRFNLLPRDYCFPERGPIQKGTTNDQSDDSRRFV